MPKMSKEFEEADNLTNPHVILFPDGGVSRQVDTWEGNGLGLRETEDDPILQPRAGRRLHAPAEKMPARFRRKRSDPS